MTIKADPDWLQRRQFAESELEIPTEEASRSPVVGCLLKFLFLKDNQHRDSDFGILAR